MIRGRSPAGRGGGRAAPDRSTRGKTAPNRLRRIDQLIAGWDAGLLRRRDGAFATAPFVDLGYGASPVTTLELARRLRRVAPGLPVAGVENDRGRVDRARELMGVVEGAPAGTGAGAGAGAGASGRPDVRFEPGGFDLGDLGPVRGVRAFNVLRQYDEADVVPAYRAMAAALLPGGLIFEGTSDPSGRVWTALIVRREEEPGDDGRAVPSSVATAPQLVVEALVLGTNFRGGIEATDFQAVLPKRLIHRMVEGEPVHAFMRDWAMARRDAAGSDAWGPRYAFARLAADLRARGHAVDPGDREPRRGRIIWRRPPVDLQGEAGP